MSPLLALIVVTSCVISSPVQAVVFDEGISLQYLHYAYAAFCDPQQLQGWNCEWCLDKNFVLSGEFYDNITEVYGYVGYNPVNETIVISVRGTSNNANWIDDFDAFLVDFPAFPGAKVHQGYYFAWRRLQDQVHAYIDEIIQHNCTTCTKVMTTGHSLGAALSGFAAMGVALNASALHVTSVGMSNFGMPRIGNPTYAAAFAQLIPNSQRMVHYHDIVPHVPMIDLGFHHMPTEIWDLSNNSNGVPQTYIVCNDSGEDPSCSDSVPAWEWDPKDHMHYMGVTNDNCGH